jgi:hypothetical protein
MHWQKRIVVKMKYWVLRGGTLRLYIVSREEEVAPVEVRRAITLERRTVTHYFLLRCRVISRVPSRRIRSMPMMVIFR